MDNINLSVTHILGFIYLAFAHQTDGLLLKDEQAEVWRKVRERTRSEHTYIQFAKIMDEVTSLYKNKMLDENIFDIVKDLANDLKQFTWFNKKNRKKCIDDLIDIAKIDGKVQPKEQEWLKTLIETWDLNENLIKNKF